MTTTTHARETPTPTVPPTIESPQAKLVYVYLAQERESTVDDIADALGLRKLSLFGVLATLEALGHVDRDGSGTVAIDD